MKKIPLSQIKRLIIANEREILKDCEDLTTRDVRKRIKEIQSKFKRKGERSLILGLYEIGFDYEDGMSYVLKLLIDYKK